VRVAAATWFESLAIAQFTQSLPAVASRGRPFQRRLAETNFVIAWLSSVGNASSFCG